MLRQRLISGITIAVAMFLSIVYLPPPGGLAVLLAISTIAQLEFYKLTNAAGIPAFRVFGCIAGALLITTTFLTIGPEAARQAAAGRWEAVVFAVTLIGLFLRQFPQKNNPQPFQTIACTLLGFLYVPVLFNYFTRILYVWPGARLGPAGSHTGGYLLMYAIAVIKCTDIGAYFTGRLIGRHKMIPRISPAKTWEGFVGGIALAVIASLVFTRYLATRMPGVPMHTHDAVILGVLLALAGVVGDLFESLLKRASGIKDSGSVLPGMGGFLDVLDSLLFGIPILYIYMQAVWS